MNKKNNKIKKFEKLKKWIRLKLIKFLGIDKIISNQECDKRLLEIEINNLKVLINNNSNFIENISWTHDKKIEKLHNTMQNIVKIGVDVDYPPMNKSWGVICIEGNVNIVKFVNLNGKTAREILGFLKQYEDSNYCIDSPHGDLFNELYKF